MIRGFSFTFRNLRTGNLYFRVAVPKHLRPIFGRSEIKKSLRTADKSIAIPLAMRLYADCQQYFRQHEENGPSIKGLRFDQVPVYVYLHSGGLLICSGIFVQFHFRRVHRLLLQCIQYVLVYGLSGQVKIMVTAFSPFRQGRCEFGSTAQEFNVGEPGVRVKKGAKFVRWCQRTASEP